MANILIPFSHSRQLFSGRRTAVHNGALDEAEEEEAGANQKSQKHTKTNPCPARKTNRRRRLCVSPATGAAMNDREEEWASVAEDWEVAVWEMYRPTCVRCPRVSTFRLVEHGMWRPLVRLTMCFFLFSQKEPDDSDRKKKTLKSKIKGSKPSHTDSKPNISYPTNFEHTVHVGFDAVTGEFTVSFLLCSSMDTFSRVCLAIMPTAFCLRIASRKSSVFTAYVLYLISFCTPNLYAKTQSPKT